MAVAVNTSGAQAATVGTEHDLATITAADVFELNVDIDVLVGGTTPDILELAIYGKARTSDTERLIKKWQAVGGMDAATPLIKCPPIVSPHHLRATLKQVQGTTRTFPWAIYETGTTPVVDTSGSQTATVGTEHDLATITAAKLLVTAVDVAAMVGGTTPDITEFRIYGKARTGDTERLIDLKTIIGTQSETLFYWAPDISPHYARITLKQTQGTGRAFPFGIYRVE